MDFLFSIAYKMEDGLKIIAEIGSNWKTLDDCLMSIAKAKEAGADAVKFQMYTAKEMYGIERDIKGVLPRAFVPQLAEVSRSVGIEFLCTGFSPDGYCFLNEFVSYHKIASAEITALDILETVNSFKKPVYLSTGGATKSQIKDALAQLKDCSVTLMFCVADYPARVVNFNHLQWFQKNIGPFRAYGYSDHSIDVLNIPSIAQDLMCRVLEKHVNFTGHKDTPDAGHSLNFEEFKLMTENLKKPVGIERSDQLCNLGMKNWQRVKTEHGYFRPVPK